jgi:hypothetical protein
MDLFWGPLSLGTTRVACFPEAIQDRPLKPKTRAGFPAAVSFLENEQEGGPSRNEKGEATTRAVLTGWVWVIGKGPASQSDKLRTLDDVSSQEPLWSKIVVETEKEPLGGLKRGGT